MFDQYCRHFNNMYLMLQRATLAEKEVTALKEQLAAANQNQAESKMAAVTGSEELNRSAIEVELSAKDKEVSQPDIIQTT